MKGKFVTQKRIKNRLIQVIFLEYRIILSGWESFMQENLMNNSMQTSKQYTLTVIKSTHFPELNLEG